MHLVLMGLRGSGKTTLGRLVAERLGREFVDLDDLTPAILDAPSVAEAWSAHGESGFRAAEAAALARALEPPDKVIALGGGTPTARAAERTLRRGQQQGVAAVVYLRASAGALRRRLAAADNTQRPSITGAGVVEEVEALWSRRDPLYRDIADETIMLDLWPDREALVEELCEILDRCG